MIRKLLIVLLISIACGSARSQEYFTITRYHVDIKVNKDASLDIDETINVRFTEQRHGIYRAIPYKYELQSLPEGTEKADRQMEYGGYARTMIENIRVDHWDWEVNNEGDYKIIKIGSADKYVSGDQQYAIRYRILNTINFFKDHSELYFNVIGDRWPTTIDSVIFNVILHEPTKETPFHFVATGRTGSSENNTITRWTNNQTLSGSTTKQLLAYEGLTVGVRLPKDFLIQQDYTFRGFYWMLLPIFVFFVAYWAWRKWGKDDAVTVKAEYYPPQNISPSICGYVVDDRFNQRDLTALIPYWGAAGYLKIREEEEKALFGLIKNKEYYFIKLKELPAAAPEFERTLFNGLFATGDEVKLSDLKNVLYKTMAASQRELQREIDRNDYYVKGSKARGSFFMIIGTILIFVAFSNIDAFFEKRWMIIALFSSAVIMLVFGVLMTKKTTKGTLLYQQLLGFKEFIRSVERDRLKEFLKQDEHYFDKILPFAIVFNVADTWKDKLEGLDVPPPTWYTGNYHGFNSSNFMNSFNQSMSTMSSTFYSSPSSKGSSGGSFGGGGSSGGGSGGGGGGSW